MSQNHPSGIAAGVTIAVCCPRCGAYVETTEVTGVQSVTPYDASLRVKLRESIDIPHRCAVSR